ncbi:mycofactocin system transcriptional regulator [Streptomyces sp. NBC_00564]|uniref:mycofactocin system transcriptional regulator n=1 Tax=Streptomyces sp. NBC_00564 TaxID=2903663 RepID=UPI002FCDA071|nr:mycofactocin system transcriptional regulator [Streptomyces sp. NBC_00564]
MHPRKSAPLGRPSATSRAELERHAFALFARKGFARTTVDDIAAAAGISRRTFFRYHASKKDLVWGDFDDHLEGLRDQLAGGPEAVPTMDAVCAAVVSFNRFDPREEPGHRRRMQLILRVPELQADATLRYAAWRSVVAEFVATRTGRPAEALLPRLVGHVVLGAALAAYEEWLDHEGADLSALLETALRELGNGFADGAQG